MFADLRDLYVPLLEATVTTVFHQRQLISSLHFDAAEILLTMVVQLYAHLQRLPFVTSEQRGNSALTFFSKASRSLQCSPGISEADAIATELMKFATLKLLLFYLRHAATSVDAATMEYLDPLVATCEPKHRKGEHIDLCVACCGEAFSQFVLSVAL